MAPLSVSSLVDDDGNNVLDTHYATAIFPEVGPQMIKLCLIGDIRQIGLRFPRAFNSCRFIHNPINVLGVEADQFILETMAAAIRSTIAVPPGNYIFVLSITDLFTFTNHVASDFYRIARAYRVLAKCLMILMQGTLHKAIVMLPVAHSNNTELDLVAAQGQSLVQAILTDTDLRPHVGGRIRFFSPVTVAMLKMEDANVADRLEYSALFRPTIGSGYVLSGVGNLRISFELANFASSWILGQLSPAILSPNQSMEDLISVLADSMALFPFRRSESLPVVAERHDLIFGHGSSGYSASPSSAGSTEGRANNKPPPLLLDAQRSGRGRKRPGPPHPPRPSPGRPGPPPRAWSPRR